LLQSKALLERGAALRHIGANGVVIHIRCELEHGLTVKLEFLDNHVAFGFPNKKQILFRAGRARFFVT